MQKVKIKSFLIGLFLIVLLLTFPNMALAHVVVKPGEVGAAARVNFVVGLPTEGEAPTVGLRLIIPEGLQGVRPNVKPGWNIELKKSGEGESAQVTEIIWTGGEIPAEQRDEFVFGAQAPADETTLIWKAYQTYEGGGVVAWDTDPKEIDEHDHDDSTAKPYSVTNVVNDLADSQQVDSTKTSAGTDNSPLIIFGVLAAVLMSGASLWMQINKKK